MRAIYCLVCGCHLNECDIQRCKICGARTTPNEFAGIFRLCADMDDIQEKLDPMIEDHHNRADAAKRNYYADIQTGVVTDPRGINE